MSITRQQEVVVVTAKQRLDLEQSEKRQRLNALLSLEKLTDEQRAEMGKLTTRMQELEVEIRAAIVAEPEPVVSDPAKGDPKLAELRGKIRLARYVEAAMETRQVDGAEGEYNAETKLRTPGAFPLELLAPEPVDAPVREVRALETRAETNIDSQTTQKRWLDRLFSETAASRVGITFEDVEAGVASYPVTTAGASAAARGRSEAAADAGWTVGVTDLKPSRNAVRAVFTEEDAMRLPTLEQALRRDLSMALAEGVDRSIFLGDSGADENRADITGLTTAANVVEKDLTQADKVKWPTDVLEGLR